MQSSEVEIRRDDAAVGADSGRPRVVALLPAWNAEEFIEATLRSLAAQTYPNLKILISDDASTDRTAEICARFAAADPRFELVRQERNLGWIGNVNALLASARGDDFFFAFHDDLIEPDYVATLVDALEQNPRAVTAFSDVRLTHAGGMEETLDYPLLEGITDRVERGRRVVKKLGHWWIPNRGVFRSWAAQRIGGLKRHRAGEFVADWPWLLHMSLLGESIRVPRVLCHKFYRKRSLSQGWEHSVFKWWAVALACAGEVRRSPLGTAEKWPLYLGLFDFSLRIIRRRWKLRKNKLKTELR
ncbi:glycosyltransferase family 2 protein [Candidatus Sumerlaeota bacterium]|nr:glycosyltransferase family 2 protein [Candidatus Sumerlaeota bacterium]